MKKSIKPAMLGMAIALGITGASTASAGVAAAAAPTNALADPDWTYEVPAGQDIESLFNRATPSGSNVYFRTEKGASSFVVQAFDRKNGDRKNWTYDLRGNVQNFISGSLVYAPNGDVYFLSKKAEDKSYTIRAVNAQGKLKWTVPVKVDVGGDLSVLPNGDIVLTNSVEATKKAKGYTTFQTFSNDGKLKSEKKTTNSGIFKMLDNGKVLRNGGDKVQVYSGVNALSKPILTYKLPEYGFLSIDFSTMNSAYAVYPLSGGGTLLEFYEQKIEEVKGGGVVENDPSTLDMKRTLVGFDAKGKQTFERSLAKDEKALAVGSGFVLQKGQTLEAYDLNNKRTGAATLEGENLRVMAAPSGEVTVSSKKDGKFYALDAKTLKANYEVDMNAGAERDKGYSFYYAGKGELYTLEAGEKTVSKYTLK
ncbi:hypothetical protein [Saccharibacillus alkalitolerans]|uniref:Uncharacterized protein n=1 Tax=Saccharibacillus alkalitolerans TaxID=2705290 RepID=A0ABX0F8E5_9BACL|nr:hypothetical protein [Saccharibacillus alkalitolerans]NGZ77241.1 hypothetical protein [Saccharibacillus alkalitolerans]